MRRVVGVVFLLAVVAGCSRSTPRAAAPPPLPEAIVPAKLAVEQGIVLQPNTTQDTASAFASPGRKSLVVEARMWELRKADRLVGALEVATLDSRRIDTARDEDRVAIRGQILAGAQSELEVAGIPVWSTKDGDRVLDVWFGRQVLCVLQVKAKDLDPEEALNELATLMTDHADWPGLPPEAFEEKDDA
jgi:hypothetical protein